MSSSFGIWGCGDCVLSVYGHGFMMAAA